MKCFYHSADLDGHCSGALIHAEYPYCEMIGINYGDEFPWDSIKPDEKVFMVDFALQPFTGMVWLNEIADLVWIDHHKSAIEASNEDKSGSIKGVRLVGRGACELVYEYLHPERAQTPTFIRLLGQYDVWDHSDPRTLPFQFGMRQKDTSVENQVFWNSLLDVEMVSRITENGLIILDYQSTENKKRCSACAFETELDGLKCIALNQMLTNSQIFDSVWDAEKYDAMLTFGFRKGSWTVSLYSTKDNIDVSIIAKNRGGGGHKGAAGFQCEKLPFVLT